MIHYHGGPITPELCAVRVWAGRHAFVSFDHELSDARAIGLASTICQSFALDNGAFTAWRHGTDVNWQEYYGWCEQWLQHPACDWAVIPDVIGGTEADNDALIGEWPFDRGGVPVWHLNESPSRLIRLAEHYPRVALGSAQEFDVSSPRRALGRLAEVLPLICDESGPKTKLHGLRMLRPEIVSRVPLSSADSTNLARNIGIDKSWRGTYTPASKETRAAVLVERIEEYHSPRSMRWDGRLTADLFDGE